MSKVFIGMSGGVDSSVSTALLKKSGFDVVGVFIKVWQPDWIECNWKEERLEAMRAAAHLDIPFVTLDLIDEYKKGVIDYMISEYKNGRTPNPDVMCNREVKFGAFWKWAKEHGADYIATGHYARVGTKDKEQGASDYTLLAGVDQNKDQSYFLWTLTPEDLKHVIFPVGGMEKTEVRKLAKKFKLPNADKKDSQGLCFIGKVDIKEFLQHYINPKPGNVLDESGKAIGTHSGVELLTIGERHGFTITRKSPNDMPYYVVSKDVTNNSIVVSNARGDGSVGGSTEKSLMYVKVSRVNWIGMPPQVGEQFKARSRYREELQDVTLKNVSSDFAELEFRQNQETLTPGQSLVMYKDERCLGGGIIQ